MEPSSTLVPERCAGLVNKINAGQCVLVLGPRIAMPTGICADGQTPIDDYLARKLLAALKEEPTPTTNLRAVLTRYEQVRGAPELRSVFSNLVAGMDAHTTQLHQDLASLPFELVIVATPDQMMFNAFKKTDGKCEVRRDYYDYCSPVASKAPPSQPSSDRPLVYSLFGRGDHSESLVLTDKNLLEYLINLTKELPPLPDTVRASLRAPSTGFLFVGFGFSNWWLRLLLKVLHITGVDNRLVSLAFEDGDSFAAAVRLENQGFFDSAGIYIQSGDWAALSRELAERYRNSAPPRIQRSELPLGRTGDERQPLVFLSYASEDRDTVNRIRDGLEARGVSVWQDVQNLRGGQNWEAKIEEFIKRVDYFVFVQTENMDRRDEGEYNYELTLALRRAKKKAFGSVFLLHVAIGNCRARPEPELAAIHRIQLDLDKGVDALADPILGAFAANSTPAPASRAV